jgi:TrpR-related protein YerC/YecD
VKDSTKPSKLKEATLSEAVLTLESAEEAGRFFRDLLTKQEIAELQKRWLAAQMLYRQIPYSKIIQKTGLSSTTVARVSRCLKKEKSGYKLVIAKLNHHHHPPSSGKDLC